MAPRTYLAASALVAAAALLAPGSAHALTATSPIQSAVKIESSNTLMPFQGFSPAYKTANSIPNWATLDSVTITVKGTSGGSTGVVQYNPTASSSVTSPGIFNLTVNGIMPVGQTNASSTATLPPAAYPAPGPSTATISVTPQTHTFNWTLTPGGTNLLPYFYNDAVALQGLAEFAPTIVGTAQEDPNQDVSFLQLLNTTDTFLTFNYTVGPAPAQTPSPLPIIGGASAFGFSRRLRNRIKQVS
jgi:hypothetical protein